MLDPSHKYAWLKLNAYGVVLAALAVMSLMDLTHPQGTELARLVGDIPPGQTLWVSAFGLAGACMFYGFFRRDRLVETAGLVLLNLALFAQICVAAILLGLTDFTLTRLIILGIIAWCLWARGSVLWSKDGLTITIPPRHGPHHPTRRR